MRTVPYAYCYKNGKIVIQEDEARVLKNLYQAYLELSSLQKAGNKAGISFAHPTIKRMLSNPIYLGQGIYPQIIKNDCFHAVQKKLKQRSKPRKTKKEPIVYKVPKFNLALVPASKIDPYEQAALIYERIEVVHEKE